MFVYVPAISGSFTFCPKYVPKEFWWWREGAIIEHHALLISYGVREDIGEDIISRFVDYFTVDLSKNIVIADSGGFEIWSRNMFIDVKELTDWQFRNANIIVALDVPPRGIKEVDNVKDWEYCKKKSKENLETLIRYASSRKAENKKIYGVVHGIALEELEDWWRNVISDNYSVLDGITYAVRPPSNPNAVMLCLAHAFTKDVKNVHLLAISGTKTLIPPVYWRNKFSLVTADSSSFSVMAGRGRCLRPFDLLGVAIGKKSSRHHNSPCHCPACLYARRMKIENRFRLDKEVKYLITYFHNLFWILTYVDYLHWLNDSEFKELCSQEGVEIHFLDCVKERDLQWCYEHVTCQYSKSRKGRRLMEAMIERNVLKKEPRRWW